jgi:hypothetical protein
MLWNEKYIRICIQKFLSLDQLLHWWRKKINKKQKILKKNLAIDRLET